ncbi:MAG: hisS, partial [Verrucomicrobiales bacterium]|nr:hisS [Verrucomicrobiales bacterium]
DDKNEYDFYQIIDKLERDTPAESEAKLAKIGISMENVAEFIQAAQPTPALTEVLNNLATRGLGGFVKIDYNVIRGLAYYSGIVFEAFDRKGDFRAIAGGGRYDQLVGLISGGKVNLSAIGFGMGDVVLCELLKDRGLVPKWKGKLDAFCIIEDESLRPDSISLVQSLREARFAVEYSLTPAKADKQFKRALELNPGYTIKLEKTPEEELVVRFKNLRTREEKVLNPDEAVGGLRAS